MDFSKQQKKTNKHRSIGISVGILLIVSAGLLSTGCFRYSFSGSGPGHIKTIAIPLFDNVTAEYGVVERLTDELILAFQKDNTLKIADKESADAVLLGSLIRVEDVPYTYESEGETANFSVGEYKLTLTVKLKYVDQVKGEVIWEQEVSDWGTYNHTSGAPEEREEGFDEAIEKLTEDILNMTVSGW
jgi:hypothetical protein